MIEIVSFSYARRAQPDADVLLDCRDMPNPHRVPGMRALDGRDPRVRRWLLANRDVARYVDGWARQIAAAPGVSVVGVGCAAGRHRSVCIAERLGELLRPLLPGVEVRVTHLALTAGPDRASRPDRAHRAATGREAWAGSTRASRLPGDWETRRRRVRARAGGQCEHVGRSGRCPRPGAECDHIARGDDHSLDNLQWLCREHHAAKTQVEARQARQAQSPRRPARRHPGLRPEAAGAPGQTASRGHGRRSGRT